jgi:UDP-glucose 4-epimerase
MARIFITGSEGFIGKYLSETLRRKGHSVTTLDLLSRKSSNHIQGDVLDFDFDSEFKKLEIDYVIHLAAQTDVAKSFSDPEFDLLINGKGTLRIALAASRAGCKNFVYAHSGGASYSIPSTYPIVESEPKSPISPYGISKNTGLEYLKYLGDHEGLAWIALALSNCYGPIEINKKGVVYEFWRAYINQMPASIYGAHVTRDFIFIDDVVEAFILALEKPLRLEVNISGGIEVSLSNLYKIQSEEMNSQILPALYPARTGEVERSVLDNNLANNLLGWRPTTELREGIKLSLGGKN